MIILYLSCDICSQIFLNCLIEIMSLIVINLLQHVVYSNWLSNSELVVVNVKPSALFAQIETGAVLKQRFRTN